jgi:hypothetical protein
MAAEQTLDEKIDAIVRELDEKGGLECPDGNKMNSESIKTLRKNLPIDIQILRLALHHVDINMQASWRNMCIISPQYISELTTLQSTLGEQTKPSRDYSETRQALLSIIEHHKSNLAELIDKISSADKDAVGSILNNIHTLQSRIESLQKEFDELTRAQPAVLSEKDIYEKLIDTIMKDSTPFTKCLEYRYIICPVMWMDHHHITCIVFDNNTNTNTTYHIDTLKTTNEPMIIMLCRAIKTALGLNCNVDKIKYVHDKQQNPNGDDSHECGIYNVLIIETLARMNGFTEQFRNAISRITPRDAYARRNLIIDTLHTYCPDRQTGGSIAVYHKKYMKYKRKYMSEKIKII